GDLEHHHPRRDTDHDASAPFRPGKIGNEVVGLLKTRMIRAVHRFQSYAIFNGGKGYRASLWNDAASGTDALQILLL
ncbi:MAG TPA: hypothetical protein VNN16_08680, partial [Candidatus Sulfotelmatobacter sp.]|nr:hypothetical protein [Candidatus Sulfotelmatobacter sp.]